MARWISLHCNFVTQRISFLVSRITTGNIVTCTKKYQKKVKLCNHIDRWRKNNSRFYCLHFLMELVLGPWWIMIKTLHAIKCTWAKSHKTLVFLLLWNNFVRKCNIYNTLGNIKRCYTWCNGVIKGIKRRFQKPVQKKRPITTEDFEKLLVSATDKGNFKNLKHYKMMHITKLIHHSNRLTNNVISTNGRFMWAGTLRCRSWLWVGR